VEFDDQLLRRVNRSRKGYTALAATIDLLAIRSMTSTDPREARQRLNDLQGGVSASITLYPGGADYRVCFAGDSVFLVQELEPEVDGTNAWANFCGHIFAISCLLNDMDRGIENPGLRVIIAAGSLLQITDPDSWKGTPWAAQTEHWFVLTGASEGLRKCTRAEGVGSGGGFVGGYCWHERPGVPGEFLGTRLSKLSPFSYQRAELYPQIYDWMKASAERSAVLASDP